MTLDDLERKVDLAARSVSNNDDFYLRKTNFIKAIKSPLPLYGHSCKEHARYAVEHSELSCEHVWTLAYFAFTE